MSGLASLLEAARKLVLEREEDSADRARFLFAWSVGVALAAGVHADELRRWLGPPPASDDVVPGSLEEYEERIVSAVNAFSHLPRAARGTVLVIAFLALADADKVEFSKVVGSVCTEDEWLSLARRYYQKIRPRAPAKVEA